MSINEIIPEEVEWWVEIFGSSMYRFRRLGILFSFKVILSRSRLLVRLDENDDDMK